VKVRKKSGRQKSPWRNSTAVQKMKRQCASTKTASMLSIWNYRLFSRIL